MRQTRMDEADGRIIVNQRGERCDFTRRGRVAPLCREALTAFILETRLKTVKVSDLFGVRVALAYLTLWALTVSGVSAVHAAHADRFLLPPFAIDAPLVDWFDHRYPSIPGAGAINFLGQDVTGVPLFDLGDGRWIVQQDDHGGYDWTMPVGTPIRAAADGVVAAVRGGVCTVPEFSVFIRHARSGHGVIEYQTLYAHLTQVIVEQDAPVVAGQIIGFVAPGNRPECHVFSTHLHFSVFRLQEEASGWRFVQVDPYGWVGSPQVPEDPWASHPQGGPSHYLWHVRPPFPELPPEFGPSVGFWLNKRSFGPGHTFQADVVANPRSPIPADVYFGVLLPPEGSRTFGCSGGDGVVFLADGFTRFVFTCLSSPISTFAPLARGVLLPTMFPAFVTERFFSFDWPSDAPEGDYLFFLALTHPGTLDVLAHAVSNVSFSR